MARTSPVVQAVKRPGLRRSPGEGNGNPLQYSCLENPHGQRNLEDYSPWDGRVRHDWSNLANTHAYVGECGCWPYVKERKVKSLSRVQPFATPWTVAYQAPLSMGFSRQEYWSGLPCPCPGDLPNLGIEPASFTPPALAGGFFTTCTTWEAHSSTYTQEKWKRKPSK